MIVQLQAQNNPTIQDLSKEDLTWKMFKETEQPTIQEFTQDKTALQLTSDDELVLSKTTEDELGFRHHRYQQMYKGMPVEGAVYLLHEKNARVQHANGQLTRQLNISSSPTLSETAALQTALQHINATAYGWNDSELEQLVKKTRNDVQASLYPSGELVVIDSEWKQNPSNSRLAYKFDIYATEPLSNQLVYVDAHTGKVLTTIEQIHNCTGVPASGSTNYSGTVSFEACEDNGTYTLKNTIGGGMQVYDADETPSYPTTPITDTDGLFNEDPTAVEVHWATEKTYDYYLNTHGRNSLDDNGMPIYSWVHYGFEISNAYWNPALSSALYGDGDNYNYTAFSDIDVVAHEMTHGVTHFSAGLLYSYESGALSESFSDIFGEVVDALYSPDGGDWMIGTGCTAQPGKNGLRNMNNPNDPSMITPSPDTYMGNGWYSGAGDNGGVHYNSGVQNYWFYLLSEGGAGVNDNGDNYNINGIGMTKAAAIAYRNLTVYLTPNSQYIDARNGAIQAAIDLYGTGSDEALQTEAAWCAVGLGSCAPESCATTDYNAMVAFYNAITDWNVYTPWDLSQPMDTWYGVTVNTDGCVVAIDFDEDYIAGTLPPELGNLSSLTSLDLGDNNFSGTIPPELGNLSTLTYLRLGGNGFTGSIPAELGDLDALEFLYFGYNLFSGSLPPELGNMDSLKYLYINGNQLSGSIPPEFENLGNLIGIDLRSNQLTGEIPAEFGNLPNISTISLHDNQLTGSIPAELGSLSTLTAFRVYNNQLSGCYDSSLANWCNQFNAYHNANARISDGNNFDMPWEDFCNTGAGACPGQTCYESDSIILRTLYDMTNGAAWDTPWDLTQYMSNWAGITLDGNGCVVQIDLSENSLTGTIPAELGDLNSLTQLDLSGNSLSGNIPLELGNLTNLTHLILNENQLNGNLPTELANLTNLERLTLTDNQLQGNIPTTFGSLSSLTRLDVENNYLEGSIPVELAMLNNLTRLILKGNNFSGLIPVEFGNLSNLTHLRLDENQLTGSIPVTLTNLTNLTSLGLDYNQLSGCYDPALDLLCSLPSSSNSNISSGNNFDATWEDFCNYGTGTCASVWPGDLNNDGKANNVDLLYWGLAEGDNGTLRPNPATSWTGQQSLEWASFVNGVNGKHQDADGNGIVDEQDLQVLEDNYGYINATNLSTDSYAGVPLKFELRQISSNSIGNNKKEDRYELHVSSSLDPNVPVNLHGLACDVDFKDLPDIISVSIDTTSSSLIPNKSLGIYKTADKKLDIGLTRVDNIDKLIDGSVLVLIVVVEDLPGGNPFTINVNGTISNGNEVLNATVGTSVYGITTGVGGVSNQLLSSVTVTDEDCTTLGSVSAQVAGGIEPYSYLWSNGATTAAINNLPSGQYTVSINDANGLYTTVSAQINGQLPVYDENGVLICGSNCPEFLVPNGNVANGLYQAGNTVDSKGIIPAGNAVEFKAGTIIQLDNGFSVQPNASFSGEIENCGGN